MNIQRNMNCQIFFEKLTFFESPDSLKNVNIFFWKLHIILEKHKQSKKRE